MGRMTREFPSSKNWPLHPTFEILKYYSLGSFLRDRSVASALWRQKPGGRGDTDSSCELLCGPCKTLLFSWPPGSVWAEVSGWGGLALLPLSRVFVPWVCPTWAEGEHRAEIARKAEEGDRRRKLPSSAHSDYDI